MHAKGLNIYIQEQYLHEMQYENYQMDMLRGIYASNLGKKAKLPPRYVEMIEKNKKANKPKEKVTKESVKNRFLELKNKS